jgi:hypothetical protein
MTEREPHQGVAALDEALGAAQNAGLVPDTIAFAPDCICGPAAVTVVIRDLWGNWILCARAHGAREWYVSGDLTEGGARGAAMDYAMRGL